MFRKLSVVLMIFLLAAASAFAEGLNGGVEITSEAKYTIVDDPRTNPLNLKLKFYPYLKWDTGLARLKFEIKTGTTGYWSDITTSLDKFNNINDAYDAIGAVTNMIDKLILGTNFAITTGSRYMDSSTLFLGTFKEASDAKMMLVNWGYQGMLFELVQSDVVFDNYGKNKNLPLYTYFRTRMLPFGSSSHSMGITFVRESQDRDDGFGSLVPTISLVLGRNGNGASSLQLTGEFGGATSSPETEDMTRLFGSAGIRYQLKSWNLESGFVYNVNKHFTGLINPKVQSIPEANGNKILDYYLDTRYSWGKLSANLLISVPFSVADGFSLYDGYDSWWLYAGYDEAKWAVSVESSLVGLLSKNKKFDEVFGLTGTLKLSFLTLKGKITLKSKDGVINPEFKLTTSMAVGTDTIANEKSKAFWEPAPKETERQLDNGFKIHGSLNVYYNYGILSNDKYYDASKEGGEEFKAHDDDAAKNYQYVVLQPRLSVETDWVDVGLRYKFYLSRDKVSIIPKSINSLDSAFYILDFIKIKDYATIKEEQFVNNYANGVTVSDYKMDWLGFDGSYAGFSAFADYVLNVPNLFGVGYQSNGKMYFGGQVTASVEHVGTNIVEFYPTATAGYRFDAGVTAELNAQAAIPTEKNNAVPAGYMFDAGGKYDFNEVFSVGLNAGLQQGGARYKKFTDTKRNADTVNNPLDPQAFWEASGTAKFGAFSANLQYGMEHDVVNPDSIDFLTLTVGYKATGFKASFGLRTSGFFVAPNGSEAFVGNQPFSDIFTNHGLKTVFVADVTFTYKFIEAYVKMDSDYIFDNNRERVAKKPYIRFGVKGFF